DNTFTYPLPFTRDGVRNGITKNGMSFILHKGITERTKTMVKGRDLPSSRLIDKIAGKVIAIILNTDPRLVVLKHKIIRVFRQGAQLENRPLIDKPERPGIKQCRFPHIVF